MSPFFFFFLLLCFILSNPPPSSAQKTLSAFSVSDSPPWGPLHNQTLLSPNSLFAAGFLALPTSPNLFNFSIWYLNISVAAAVWSANPIKSPLGPNATLSFTAAGTLRLVNSSSSGENLWPRNESSNYSNKTSLVLRNDGNLIYSHWQSFDFPTDTVLPNQSIDNITLVSNNDNFTFTNSTKLVFNQTEVYHRWDNAFQKLHSDGNMTQANGESFIVSDFGLNRSQRMSLDNDGNLHIYSLIRSLYCGLDSCLAIPLRIVLGARHLCESDFLFLPTWV